MNTVDTTGAGDSYIGALLCKIVDDRAVLEVIIPNNLHQISLQLRY